MELTRSGRALRHPGRGSGIRPGETRAALREHLEPWTDVRDLPLPRHRVGGVDANVARELRSARDTFGIA